MGENFTAEPLPRSFYAQNTVIVAKKLLGKLLVRNVNGKILSGIITETEAYCSIDDPASHAFRKMTPRNQIMFGEVGKAYVYFTYGMHYCVNAVAKSKEAPAGAVLIRAIEAKQGIDEMIKNRKKAKLTQLSNGPAKLTQALRISQRQYGIDLTEVGELFITEGISRKKITSSPRIGIRKATEKLWNFKI